MDHTAPWKGKIPYHDLQILKALALQSIPHLYYNIAKEYSVLLTLNLLTKTIFLLGIHHFISE